MLLVGDATDFSGVVPVFVCVSVEVLAAIAWRKAADKHTEKAAEEPRPAPNGKVEMIVT